jgi:hypothetical protein
MAFLRKRASGNYSLSFKWKGKSRIKALGTNDEQIANEVKKDAEEQLKRIRRGESALASKLLADGHDILDVLFGSEKTAHLVPSTTDDNPLYSLGTQDRLHRPPHGVRTDARNV